MENDINAPYMGADSRGGKLKENIIGLNMEGSAFILAGIGSSLILLS